ncbi:hypothetical protein HN858_03970 [Candidatus Falkowbacteria bacterium]|jgi:hypothetical protein|nr:hypothetical protein [Candidatus Falkowbacteria bacterium]MBT5503665.1 hypothetical protein [Candidatus Falkowbacteria bacterium]MBT6574457.1 hypothetical protein [Candidatus Falkowbacteria bacterium]MBT7348804.1 hypothetical protein [Candidatus Falkowbacteria bacterium]MBT7501229.1 hypothetical protein [Candidatus Falkowbacteria bacterium]
MGIRQWLLKKRIRTVLDAVPVGELHGILKEVRNSVGARRCWVRIFEIKCPVCGKEELVCMLSHVDTYGMGISYRCYHFCLACLSYRGTSSQLSVIKTPDTCTFCRYNWKKQRYATPRNKPRLWPR